MKKWLVVACVVAILIIGGYFLLSFYAVRLIEARLQKVIGPGFTVTEIKIKPTYLYSKGVQYEDIHSRKKLLQIEEARIYPALLSFLRGSLQIREFRMVRPSFFFYRSQDGRFVGPWVGLGKGREEREISEEEGHRRGEPIHIQINRIRIEKGSINFEDRKVGEPSAQINLRDLNFEMKDIVYPTVSARSAVKLEGKVKGKTEEGTIFLKGWIDIKTMDMETSLKVHEIEVKTFEPYYRKEVTAEIDSGSINLESKITVRGKKINAPGELDLMNLQVKEGSGMVLWIPAKTLVTLLEQKDHRLHVRFLVNGDLDNPQFNLQEALLTQIGISLAEALGVPIKVVGKGILQGALKGEKGIVEGLKSLEELFMRKKERKR
jgi:hypothetical protein